MDNIIIYNTDDGQANVKLYAIDGTVWPTLKAMAELVAVQPSANGHKKSRPVMGRPESSEIQFSADSVLQDIGKVQIVLLCQHIHPCGDC